MIKNEAAAGDAATGGTMADGSHGSVARGSAAPSAAGQGIHRAIVAVMTDVEAIGKDRRADTGGGRGYNFRGIDDVYNELHPILARHGVFTVPRVLAERSEERTSSTGKVLIYRVLTMRYRFYAVDGSFVDAVVIGEGMDHGDKAANKSMAVAHKYALMQVFAIPTEDAKDPEVDADHSIVATFDRNNAKHVDNVRGECKRVHMTADEFRKVVARMHGGPATDERLKEIIAAVGAETMKAPPSSRDDGVTYEPEDDGLGKPLAPGERPRA